MYIPTHLEYRTVEFKGEKFVRLQEVIEKEKQLDELEKQIDESIEALVKKTKKLERGMLKLRHDIEKKDKRLESRENEIGELKAEIQLYKRTYGEYISPHTIIKNLYRGRGQYEELVSYSNLKLKISEKQFDYWIGIFTDLGICRPNNRGRYLALVDRYRAFQILIDNNKDL